MPKGWFLRSGTDFGRGWKIGGFLIGPGASKNQEKCGFKIEYIKKKDILFEGLRKDKIRVSLVLKWVAKNFKMEKINIFKKIYRKIIYKLSKKFFSSEISLKQQNKNFENINLNRQEGLEKLNIVLNKLFNEYSSSGYLYRNYFPRYVFYLMFLAKLPAHDWWFWWTHFMMSFHIAAAHLNSLYAAEHQRVQFCQNIFAASW